jgi:hypothetical protein
LKKSYTARADNKIFDTAAEIYNGSLNSLIEKLLKEYIAANRPTLEILLEREKELSAELEIARENVRKERERLNAPQKPKKEENAVKIEKTPLEGITERIFDQLQSNSIETILKTPYIKAYAKRLGWTEQQVIELVISTATPEKRKEYNEKVTSHDITFSPRGEGSSSSSSSSSSSR